MGNVYFFTGYPGFIANQLITGLIAKRQDIEMIYVLSLPTMKQKGEEWKRNLVQKFSFPEERFQIIEGDITQEDLGIDTVNQKRLQKSITHLFHLAAIYDLAVKRDIAYKVNVQGTDHVNLWARKLAKLKHYIYFSTAYVAGRRKGKLLETELIQPESFKNFYEETKFAAEVLVERMKPLLPVTIIRPGIVKGHSKSGETIKFDGPYMILNILDQLRKMPFFPLIGSGETVVNLVPIDFIVNSVLYLSHADKAVGKTYHLTDPNPYKVKELYQMFLKEMLNKQPKGMIPLGTARALLSLSSIRKKLRAEKEVLEYFAWQAQFDSSQAQEDLKEAGIHCPDFKLQVPSMVRFYLVNKDNPNYHIQIK